MSTIKEHIEQELKKLNRTIVATPETREHLDNFAKSNNGANDVLLTQLAVNYGYKTALLNLLDEVTKEE